MRKTFQATGAAAPSEGTLHWTSLGGDLIANTAYYAMGLAFGPREATWLGPVLGVGAGVGAVALPGPLGLDEAATNRADTTKMLAVGLYFVGRVVATATYRALLDEQHDGGADKGRAAGD